MKAILICGSRNPNGQTAATAGAVLEGLAKAGVPAEKVFLPALAIERCRQCDDSGWGLCRKEGRCVIEDDMAGLVEKMRQADAVVFASPVYFSDMSESLRAFTDRLRRICMQEAGRSSIKGKPAIGVCVAGGGGVGAPECCASLKKVAAACGFAVAEMIPVKRQDLREKTQALERAGQSLASGLARN